MFPTQMGLGSQLHLTYLPSRRVKRDHDQYILYCNSLDGITSSLVCAASVGYPYSCRDTLQDMQHRSHHQLQLQLWPLCLSLSLSFLYQPRSSVLPSYVLCRWLEGRNDHRVHQTPHVEYMGGSIGQSIPTVRRTYSTVDPSWHGLRDAW